MDRLTRIWRSLFPKKIDLSLTLQRREAELRTANAIAADAMQREAVREAQYRADYVERAAELIEARSMAGAGPWLVAESRDKVDTPQSLRESSPIASQGAYGDIDLALANVEWRREVNISWLEFSRWGIQQIILICRLYYIKNPILRRLVDVSAAYVFARGVDVSSPDERANEVLTEFFERNKTVLGQNGLVASQRSKDTDGNLFFCLFRIASRLEKQPAG